MTTDIHARRSRICRQLYNKKACSMKIKRGTPLENSTKSRNNTLLQEPASANCGFHQQRNTGDLGNNGPWKKQLSLSSQLFSTVKHDSCSQRQPNFPNSQMSQATPHKLLYTQMLKKYEGIRTEKLKIYVMKTNSQSYPCGRLSWPGSPLPHFIFRSRLTNLKF